VEIRTADKLLGQLKGVKATGANQWMACCPAHEDSTPSLSISQAADGKVLLKCFAGCSAESIVTAVGLKLSDLFPEREKRHLRDDREPVPPGKYVCRIGKVKDGKAKDGSDRWCVQWIVCAGPEKERLIFDWLSATGTTARRLKVFAKAVGLETTGTSNLTHELVIGRTATVEVEPAKERDGRPRTRVAFDGYAPPDQTAYDYRDEDGKILFQAVRFRPKAFLQRKPNAKGGWVWTTKDVRRVIYRLPELLAAPREKVRWWCEGEKDCDRLWALGLVATTTSQGASSFGKTDEKALAALKGSDVVVLPDNDKAGRDYAGMVAAKLKTIVRSIKILTLPGLPDGGDVSDWLDRGGTCEELDHMAADPSFLEAAAETRAGRPHIENYRKEEEPNSDGKIATVYYRLPIDEIVASVYFATDGWPKRLGSDLFYDQDGTLGLIESTDCLMAYLHSVGDVRWRTGSDDSDLNFVTVGALMERLQSLSEVIHEVTDVPLEPPPSGRNVYQLKRRRDNRQGVCDGSCFRELLAMFNPASEEDAAILQAMALTPFWGGRPGRRPLFIITGKEGIGLQSIGKSTVAEVVGELVGGYVPIKVPKGDVADDIAKQLLSAVALSRRVVLLDNISGTLASDELAQLITATNVMGRPAFGRQRERKNYLTWIATAVSPSLSEDLTKRSVVLELSEPSRQRLPTFREDLDDFIEKNLARLILEAGFLLREARHPIVSAHSRFPSWDREVLACHPAADLALARIHERQVVVDERGEEVSLFLDEILGKVLQHSQTRVSPTAAMRAWNDANGTRYSARWVGRILRKASRENQLPAWLTTPTRRGGPWSVDLLGARRHADEGGDEPAKPESRPDLF
jgi:Toprim domain-containing protein